MAALLLVHATTLLAAYFVLAAVFEFPAVLRKTPTEILALFGRAESIIVPTYYGFTLTGVTFILMAVAMREALCERDSSWNRLSSTLGVLAGITQAFGFIRWVWLVPSLAATVNDSASTVATRAAALLVFEAMHQFAGVSIGENLSFWFQGLWTLSVSAAIYRHPRFDRNVACVGLLSGLSFVVYTLEQFGGPFAALGELNVVFHAAWIGWMLVVASMLLRADASVPPEDGRVQVGWKTAAAAVTAVLGLVAVVSLRG